MKKLIVLMMAGSLVLGLAGCSSEAEKKGDDNEKKVGIVYTVSGKGDMSFNDAAYAGIVKAEEELGVEVDEIEPASLAETEQAIEDMSAESTYDLIIGITYEAQDPVAKIAPNYPEQQYALVDCEVGMDNVVSYIARENESAFMMGCLAGLLQNETENALINEDNAVGVVGAVDTEVVNKHIAGYMSGARYVNPDIEVYYDYSGDFSDTAAAQALAETMNRNGADIIYNAAAASGLGVFRAAEENQFMAIGLDSNQNSLYPDNIVASSLKMVDEFVYGAIEDALNDEFQGGQTFSLGLKENGVSYTFDESNIQVSDEIKKSLEDIEAKIVSGELEVPASIDEVDSFLEDNSY